RRKTQQRVDGWLGRYLDQQALRPGADVPALHLGGEKQPKALEAESTAVPSISSIEEFRFQGGGQTDFQSRVEELNQLAQMGSNTADDLLGFVHASTNSALVASRQVNASHGDYQSNVRYPDSALANKLKVVALLIDAGLSTRVYYVELDGFDTHAAQLETHAILLRDWSQALNALVRDLEDKGHGQRVCVMSYSEFGRRVAENASGGTDHGAAAPMFFAGGGLQQPWVGVQPSLTDLQDGDLKYAIDFRQAYASVLRDWLRTDPVRILDGQYDSLPLFRSRV
ncbi:MAG: DUF1501 domain-containing protein, partial [bacterium]|nr:DUF1501 domain-containing protein [bacterium]